ncbi:MAG: hypothetical protein JWQ02_799, partial [Capsulimonas sp.]|nr:hypothetical protein [Capsulimonas sp.]
MTSQKIGGEARLTVGLFGPNVSVQFGAQPTESLKLRSRKGLWLFALLALRPNKPVARDWAAAMLWPDSETARETLRRTLTDLRAALTPHSDLLEATHSSLRLCLPELSVDIHRFDAALKRGAQADLEQAIALYQGPLLEECPEAWIISDRNRYADAYRGALERLAAIYGKQGRYGEAVSLLRLALAADPLRESACRALMEALAAGGEPAEAIFVYRNFRVLLRRDLNTEPSPPTVALYRAISSGNGVKAVSAPPAGVSSGTSATVRTSEASAPASSRPATNLPYPLTALLGREEEMNGIVRLLERSRLVTLTGTGGLGKTRLAIAIGHAQLDSYNEGVWFVDLAAISDPHLVPAAAAVTLSIREEVGKSVTETLAARLRSRSLLLIVDNCEHVIDASASFVRAIVTSCPSVRVLATSRQPLGFTGEVVRKIDPLGVPEPVPAGGVAQDALDDLLFHSAALRLFVERAEAVQPSFCLTSESLPPAVEICRRLEGVPLALELAAARVATMPVAQVASLLQDRFRLLTDGDRTAQPRQQSLRALVDWSYELLHPREREFFSRLSVFAGGWTVEAAVAVCDPDSTGLLDDSDREEMLDLAGVQESVAPRVWDVRNMLEALVARSLVLTDRNAEGEVRYRMLETLREYADERRRAVDTQDETRRRHVLWYRRFADGAYQERIGANHSRALRLLDQDHDNFRLALQTAGPGPERMRLAAALYWYWYIHGHYSEGRSWSERALNECPDAPAALRTRLMKALGDFSWAQGDMTTARRIHLENLELQRTIQDRRMIAVTLNSLGLIDYHQGDCAGAVKFYRQSLEITR